MHTFVRNAFFAVALVVTTYASTARAQATDKLMTTVYAGVGANVYSFSPPAPLPSDTTTRFGIHAGVKTAYPLSAMFSGMALANVAVTFGSGQTPVPLTAAAGIQLDRVVPFDLALGVGFTFVAGMTDVNPVGFAVLLHGFYPLPNMGFGVFLQAQENILNNDLNLFQLDGGIGFRF